MNIKGNRVGTFRSLNCSVILLAAGGSTRLGQPKQLLSFRGKSLVQHAANQALSLNLPVYVVVGARNNSVTEQLTDFPVKICTNKNWKDGMGSSIQFAMSQLESSIRSTLIMLCDQPFIDTDYYTNILRQALQTPDTIIATKYPDNRQGVPAYFPAQYFQMLKTLAGDQGARQILKQAGENLRCLPCIDAARDIDTIEQAKQLKKAL